MINVQNLSKSYNGTTVLKIDTLEIPKGQSFGLVGNNGAGKPLLQLDIGFDPAIDRAHYQQRCPGEYQRKLETFYGFFSRRKFLDWLSHA